MILQMSLIDHLLQSFCKRDRRATEISSAYCDFVSENNGDDLPLLFDGYDALLFNGYDEYPESLMAYWNERSVTLLDDVLNQFNFANRVADMLSYYVHAYNLHTVLTLTIAFLIAPECCV